MTPESNEMTNSEIARDIVQSYRLSYSHDYTLRLDLKKALDAAFERGKVCGAREILQLPCIRHFETYVRGKCMGHLPSIQGCRCNSCKSVCEFAAVVATYQSARQGK